MTRPAASDPSSGTPPAPPLDEPRAWPAPSGLTAVWANDGGDKVARGELRASPGRAGRRPYANPAWRDGPGGGVRVWGARNEVVQFNVVLEAATRDAPGVAVSFDRLVGPGGYAIAGAPAASRRELFSWTSGEGADARHRDIELFYVRYVPIRGISLFAYVGDFYDTRHAPRRMRRNASPTGDPARGGWADRPDHDAEYPEIAVPLELHPDFTVAAGTSQSIWCDVYVPPDAPAGVYAGTLTVREAGQVTRTVPVRLTVRPFALPDRASFPAIVAFDAANVAQKFTGNRFPGDADPAARLVDRVSAVAHRLMHRHRVDVSGGGGPGNPGYDGGPLSHFEHDHLSGRLFSAARGYRGPGAGVGTGYFWIGTYGGWATDWGLGGDPRKVQSSAGPVIRQRLDSYEAWFRRHAPLVQRAWYVMDEAPDVPTIARVSALNDGERGIGRAVPAFATMYLTETGNTPGIDHAASWVDFAGTRGGPRQWVDAVAALRRRGGQAWFYNGRRPGTGTFCTEEAGAALRSTTWTMAKLGLARWFFWQSNYWYDFQTRRGAANDLFHSALTFGQDNAADPVKGRTGWNYNNGDGVLLYPGTDRDRPNDSYGVEGLFVSLRLKHWRRGIQDGDYIALARRVNARAADAIVSAVVPQVGYEIPPQEAADPSYARFNPTFPEDPAFYEAARAGLAEIITGAPTASAPG